MISLSNVHEIAQSDATRSKMIELCDFCDALPDQCTLEDSELIYIDDYHFKRSTLFKFETALDCHECDDRYDKYLIEYDYWNDYRILLVRKEHYNSHDETGNGESITFISHDRCLHYKEPYGVLHPLYRFKYSNFEITITLPNIDAILNFAKNRDTPFPIHEMCKYIDRNDLLATRKHDDVSLEVIKTRRAKKQSKKMVNCNWEKWIKIGHIDKRMAEIYAIGNHEMIGWSIYIRCGNELYGIPDKEDKNGIDPAEIWSAFKMLRHDSK